MFVKFTVYEVWISSLCYFGVDQPFCYVVCEHLHNLEEGVNCLTVFCFRVKFLIMYKNLILVFFFSEFQHHKIKKLMLSKSQLTSNVLNSFLPSFKNLTYLDLRSNSLTSFTNTLPQIKTIDIRWASFFANLRFCWISFSMWLLLMSVWLLSFYFQGSKLVRFSAKNPRKLLYPVNENNARSTK